ncbi:MAG: hypothetical protein GX256_00650 [Fretibacterium sp.]|nr:hypothetical protein [Fretibacterium sp.]
MNNSPMHFHLSATLVFLSLAALTLFLCPPAHANKVSGEFFALSSKLIPGASQSELEEILGAPAEQHLVGGNKNLKRTSWLHGEMGVEVYFVDEKAYRIILSRNFAKAIETARTLDALTREGAARYSSMPRFDPAHAEYYWISGDLRFSFAKDGPNAVRVICVEAP